MLRLFNISGMHEFILLYVDKGADEFPLSSNHTFNIFKDRAKMNNKRPSPFTHDTSAGNHQRPSD